MRRLFRAFALCVSLAVCAASFNASAKAVSLAVGAERSPGSVLRNMNELYERGYASVGNGGVPLIGKLVSDGAGGFDLCGSDGDRTLYAPFTNLRVHGATNGGDDVRELSFFLYPASGFSERFARESGWLLRIGLLSAFPDLSEADLRTLMQAFVLEMLPYRYETGDEGVADARREIALLFDGELVLFESAASGEDDSLQLRLSFIAEPDDREISEARMNGWRVEKLSRALFEMEMIACCADALSQSADVEAQALVALIDESLDAYALLRLSCCPQYKAFAEKADSLSPFKNFCKGASSVIE